MVISNSIWIPIFISVYKRIVDHGVFIISMGWNKNTKYHQQFIDDLWFRLSKLVARASSSIFRWKSFNHSLIHKIVWKCFSFGLASAARSRNKKKHSKFQWKEQREVSNWEKPMGHSVAFSNLQTFRKRGQGLFWISRAHKVNHWIFFGVLRLPMDSSRLTRDAPPTDTYFRPWYVH